MRAYADRDGPAGTASPAARPLALRGPLHALHRGAGNRAVGALLRARLARKVGWPDAVSDGYAWNAGEHVVDGVRRIPLADLPVGLSKDAPIRTLTTESAERRAIVLVPVGLDAKQPVEYVVFLHGHTEDATSRPFAGYRAYKPATPPPPKKKGAKETLGESLRHGIDAKDVAPVRDVALDEAEAQLGASGLEQVVIILPQGGLYSQFENPGDPNPQKRFYAATYVSEIAKRLLAERCWLGPDGKPVTDKQPKVKRITMAGHSGAGATLGNMVESDALVGDLVIFDAINGSQLGQFQKWVLARLDKALDVLTGSGSEADKLAYLAIAPKLRGFYSNLYKDNYEALEKTIRDWFKAHKAKLGPYARCLRANFMLQHVTVQHEHEMRGLKTATGREGGILGALQSLHGPAPTSAAACPKMPEELEEEKRERARRRAPARRATAPRL